MAENKEFISAADLPVAEGKEVNVLCVENGEMKQMPMNVGGTEYDIVVRVTGSWDAEESWLSTTGEIVSGSFDAVVQKLDSGVMPIGLVIQTGASWEGCETKAVREFVPAWEKFPDEEGFMYINCYDYSGYLYADGTFEID